nr:zinc finger protein RFP-like [Anolis sagrei ordinatus]
MADAPRAQDPLQDLCEEATCPVCLDYFKDPVILDCGHNFCRACLTQTWEKLGNTQTSCPHCREIVSSQNLRTNQQLANIVEKVKILSLQGLKKAQDKERGCEKHQEPLKPFCTDDETPFCKKCDKEHLDHRVILLGTSAEDYKGDAEMEKIWFLKDHKKHLLAQLEEKEYQIRRKTNDEELPSRENLILKMQEKLLQEDAEMEKITQNCWFLKDKKKHLWTQMEEMEHQTEKKRNDQELSSLENLILKMQDELLQAAKSLSQRYFVLLIDCTSSPFASLCFPSSFSLSLSPTANVTLDPDTRNPCLILSEDQKSVRFGDKPQDLPDNPERFSDRMYVLGREGFTSGRHFWEVVVEGEGDWSVGVARKSVRRKGSVDPGPEEGIWDVGKWGGEYCATSCPASSDFLLSKETKRVRVCLNCTSNQVAFYNADTGDQICLLSEVPFSGEPVLPFFSAFKVHLRISP